VVQRAAHHIIVVADTKMLGIDARAAGYEHGHRRQGVLHHHVGGQRSAQYQPLDVLGPLPLHQQVKGRQQCFVEVVRVGRYLDVTYQSPGVEKNRVAVRATDIQANDHGRAPLWIVTICRLQEMSQRTGSAEDCQLR